MIKGSPELESKNFCNKTFLIIVLFLCWESRNYHKNLDGTESFVRMIKLDWKVVKDKFM